MQNAFTTPLSRRHFGSGLAVGAAAIAMGAAPKSNLNEGWIDAHVHVWTPDTSRYPLDDNFTVAAMQPPSFTPEQLFAHSRPAGVTRVVLIQMSFYRYDNRYMLDAIAAHPDVFSGVGIVNHRAPDVAQQMRRLASRGVRGFRINTSGNDVAEWPSDEGMATLWRTARDEGLAVCPLINPSDLPHIHALCKRFPETTVVVDHFARVGISGQIVDDELKQLCDLARFPNTHVKTSAFYALGKKKPPYTDLLPMIRRVVEAYGPQRLMWASDCPYQVQDEHTYAASIALIRDHADFLSASDKQAILRDTAERVFFS